MIRNVNYFLQFQLRLFHENLFAMDDIVNKKGTARKLSQLSNLEGKKVKTNKIYLRLKLLSSKYSAFGGTSFQTTVRPLSLTSDAVSEKIKISEPVRQRQ